MVYIIFTIVDSGIYIKYCDTLQEVNQFLAETTPAEIKYKQVRIFKADRLEEILPDVVCKIKE